MEILHSIWLLLSRKGLHLNFFLDIASNYNRISYFQAINVAGFLLYFFLRSKKFLLMKMLRFHTNTVSFYCLKKLLMVMRINYDFLQLFSLSSNYEWFFKEEFGELSWILELWMIFTKKLKSYLNDFRKKFDELRWILEFERFSKGI